MILSYLYDLSSNADAQFCLHSKQSCYVQCEINIIAYGCEIIHCSLLILYKTLCLYQVGVICDDHDDDHNNNTNIRRTVSTLKAESEVLAVDR